MKNLDVRWIIESDVLSYTDNLVKYLKKNDIYYKETNYQDILSFNYDDNYGGLIDTEVATIVIGSLRFAKEIDRYPISPGAICTLKRFDCTNYYPSWNPYLLNKDWIITMKSILQRDIASKSYYFRPNEGDKRFTGGVYPIREIQELDLPSNQILIQADEKTIGDEYRFLVVDRKVIAGTRYLPTQHGESGVSIAQKYLEQVLQDTNLLIPDRAFTVDIGFDVDSSRLKVIELNSFFCANLYSMDMSKVVPAINVLAKQMYLEDNCDI